MGSMSFFTPLLNILEESGILWKLTLCFLDLRVIVPISNLIEALAVVKNGVHKMKGLFSFSLISKITKSIRPFIGEFRVGGVGHDVYVEPLIDEGVHVLKVPYAARLRTSELLSVVGCHLRPITPYFFIFCQRGRIHVLGDGEFGFLSYYYFLRGSASREFLEKPEHFSHPTIDLLALLENGVLKSFHPFEVDLVFELEKSPVRCIRDALRCRNGFDWFDEFFCFIPTFMVVEGEVLNNFPRFVAILIAEFSAGGAVNLALKMKGDMIIENLDLKPTINAMMRDFLE
ncbi:hypothetical protein Tco_0530472 [Tanacetum coccineum]